MSTESITITINPLIKKELNYLFESLKEDKKDIHGFESVNHLINYILSSVTTGSRRPYSWERRMLAMMAIIPDNEIFNYYRREYGEPNGSPKVKNKFKPNIIKKTRKNHDIPFEEMFTPIVCYEID